MARNRYKLKAGDEVIVLAGKDKGKTGTISQVVTRSDKVVVSGINVAKFHQKRTQDAEGGIFDKELPIHISNVALHIDGKASRVGYKTDDGKKVRFAKVNGEVVN